VAQWSAGLPPDKKVVTHCVRRGSVSNAVVDALRARSLNTRFIAGGIEAWKNAGGATVSK
jgi:Fe-Mn family superoxide dismutase